VAVSVTLMSAAGRTKTFRTTSKAMTHLLAVLLLVPFFAFAEERTEVALRAADDDRILAMRSPDREKLGAVFSDDLRYAHSNGVVDNKASFIDILLSGKTKYVGYDHVERTFTFPAPEIALMAGRARIQAETAGGKMDSILSYLAVWRLENGRWRFLAWQSCRLPPAGGK
jgi:Domain of unknown function (DUF4440)